MKASGMLGVCCSATLSMYCAGLRFWYRRHVQTGVCVHASVQTHGTAENSYLVGNKGGKGWLSEKKAC